jgi:hypothetical protein
MKTNKEADAYFSGMGFAPQLSPNEILCLGAFDGHYFGAALPDEYPATWSFKAKLSPEPDPTINFFGVHSGQSRQVWIDKGWMHDDDPLGWFQWYCRYYLGRRHEDDARQIKRWKNYTRHIGMLYYHAKGQPLKGIVQRQSLIHWAYDPYPDLRQMPNESIFQKAIRIRGCRE